MAHSSTDLVTDQDPGSQCMKGPWFINNRVHLSNGPITGRELKDSNNLKGKKKKTTNLASRICGLLGKSYD